MASIEENKNRMTIFYMKSDGSIVNFSTGIQNMDFYGKHKEDYSKIYDFLVVDFDDYVMNNLKDFYVNTEENKLKLKQNLSKYM